MEPLSALGLATNIIQFVDFSSKLVAGSIEVYKSASGQFEHHVDLERITRSLSEVTSGLGNSECSADLIDALSKLKSQKGNKWGSFVATLKSILGRDKLETLQRRLDGYRQQLILLVLVALKEDRQHKVNSKLDHLFESNEHLGETFLNHISESSKWREDLLTAIRNSHCHNASAGLYETPGKDTMLRDQSFLEKVLFSLRFREMPDRHERIPVRHQETYEWIFRERQDSITWDSFVNWLKGTSSTYWVTGKPGSGKSTLMKFTFDDQRTRRILESCTELKADKLIISGFFFWNSGAPIQMSQFGLIQTLLHDCLQQCPDLLPLILPHWLEEYQLFGKILDASWTWLELTRSFRNLLEKSSARFCFFIDGLDEYTGDHQELIGLLNSIASLRNVKMCVASRPWPVFEDAFLHHAPSLWLQDLTYRDIAMYISDKLNSNRGYSDLSKEELEYALHLVENIARKASGVFLWVTVVVASLLNGLTDGDRVADLQMRLDALPPDLEGLFGRILDSIEPLYKSQAFKLFLLVKAAKTPLTLLQLSYADESEQEAALKLPIGNPITGQLEARARRMRRRVNSRCKGLLETASQHGNGDMAFSMVEYLHRTVKDFMEKPAVKERLISALESHFDAYSCLASAMLVQMKISQSVDEAEFREISFSCIKYADLSADTPKDDTTFLVRLVNELHKTAIKFMRDSTGIEHPEQSQNHQVRVFARQLQMLLDGG